MALQNFGAMDIIPAPVSPGPRRTRGTSGRLVRSNGTGGGSDPLLCAPLFDIVDWKEGMRGRRSPDAGTMIGAALSVLRRERASSGVMHHLRVCAGNSIDRWSARRSNGQVNLRV